jgi:hypothetical protein
MVNIDYQGATLCKLFTLNKIFKNNNMQTFKSKSLVPHKTDNDIKNGCFSTRFISFETAIQMFRKEYNLTELKNAPLGYRVTDQGIEIISE